MKTHNIKTEDNVTEFIRHDYRRAFYSRYVSAFKTDSGSIRDYAFTDSKLIPMLDPWVCKLNRGGACLDLGCGHGNILHALRTLGFTNLAGADISSEQIEIARTHFPYVEQMGIMEKLRASAPGSFQLITLFDVLEHLSKEEIMDLFELIVTRLDHDGVLIIHCPNGESPFVGSVRYGDFTHETILTPQSARNICRIYNLKFFEARENYGFSRSLIGSLRNIAWMLIRQSVRMYNLIETGEAGSGIVTRNFCFRAIKCE